jgi:membrane protein DedA with SNARE-associated domain
MSLEHLVSTYGYMGVSVGGLLVEETVLVLAGISAHLDYLKLQWVIIYAFIGTFGSSEILFYIGRMKGKTLLKKYPTWREKSQKAFTILEKNKTLVIVGFRFLFGFRTIMPIFIGMSSVSSARFLLLNILGAFVWTVVFAVLGYLFGHTLELFLGEIKKHELVIFSSIIVFSLAIWGVYRLKKYLMSK